MNVLKTPHKASYSHIKKDKQLPFKLLWQNGNKNTVRKFEVFKPREKLVYLKIHSTVKSRI